MTASASLVVAMTVFGGLLLYVYTGYLRCLRCLRWLVGRRAPEVPSSPTGALPSVVVVIAVHDEAGQIVDRARNVLDQDYPPGLLEVLVASDGSTDGIEAVVADQLPDRVRVVHRDQRVGKSAIQNLALETVDPDRTAIVAFTDADTRFDPGCLRDLLSPFGDDAVGATQALVLFDAATPGSSSTAVVSQGRYWRTELRIRQLEADLDILAVASGACVAVRRSLWRPLDPSVGEDCMIPLDVIGQGRRVAYVPTAVARDHTDDDLRAVVPNRARMTLRNWQGTWSRPRLLNPFRHLGYAWALWSHKVLRWLSPLWLLGLAGSAAGVAVVVDHRLAPLPLAGLGAVLALALVGGIGERVGRPVPIGSSAWAFLLANVGFGWGLVQVVRGRRVTGYR